MAHETRSQSFEGTDRRSGAAGMLSIRNLDGEIEALASIDWPSGTLELMAADLAGLDREPAAELLGTLMGLARALDRGTVVLRGLESLGNSGFSLLPVEVEALEEFVSAIAQTTGLGAVETRLERRGQFVDFRICLRIRSDVPSRGERCAHLRSDVSADLIVRAASETKKRIAENGVPPGLAVA